jgi:exopolysaccharide biosynthesis polyprenyl glycosylphosphotransferase
MNLRRDILLKTYKLFDLLTMTCAFLLTTWVSCYSLGRVSFIEFMEMRIKLSNIALFLGFLFIWHLIFSAFGLYESRRLSNRYREVADVVKATSLGTLAIGLFGILFRISLDTPVVLLIFWTGTAVITILSRLTLRSTLESLRRRGRNLRHMLIIGTNPRAIRLAREVESKPELGYRLMGFVDSDYAGAQEFRKVGYSLVADLKEFPGFIRSRMVDEVLICLPLRSHYVEASKIVACCEEQGIMVKILSDLFDLKLAHSNIEQLGDESIITLSTGSMEGWAAIFKRTFDVVVSFVLVLLFTPLFLITAFLIKITSQGPAFFVQERLGLNKRRFPMYKFRTMVVDAEKRQAELEHLNEADGPVFKIMDDPRITPIGKLLRGTSIDELPQLFNVLMGDMSLVGPRPLPVRDFEGFEQDWHRRRFSVRPGISCLWQINGRSSVSFERWMELDMEYIDKWSLWLDFKILAKTVSAVLKGSGAA